LLGREDAAIAGAFGVEQEVALLAEQAEAVADLPGDLQRGGVIGGLRGSPGARPCREESRKQDAGEDRTKGSSDHGGLALLVQYVRELRERMSDPKPAVPTLVNDPVAK
jgi:hypothetical protein